MTSVTVEQSPAQTLIARPKPSFWRAETISHKLTLGFLIILLLLAASGAVAYFELATVGKDAKKMEVASMQAMDASHLERLSETTLIPVHDYILTGDPTAKARFEKSASDLEAIISELGVKVNSAGMSGMATGGTTTSMTMAIPLSTEQMGLLQNLYDLWMTVRDKAGAIFAMPDPVGNQQAISQLEEMEATAQSMAAYAQSIHVVQMESVSNTQNQANLTIVKTSLFLIAVIAIAFLLGTILSRVISRAISKPMAQLTQISSNISMGDLDTKVNVKASGEIGELAEAIERMRTSLKIIFDRLSDEEEDLRTWTSQLANHELRRKVRGGIISLGGHKYVVGKELDGQYVYVRLDYDLREIVITPTVGEPRHLALAA